MKMNSLHSVEKTRNFLTEKIFREINSLSFRALVLSLFSNNVALTKIFKKIVRENFVISTLCILYVPDEEHTQIRPIHSNEQESYHHCF